MSPALQLGNVAWFGLVREQDGDAASVQSAHLRGMRDFKKLLVWQRAYALSIGVHDAVRGIRRGSEHTELKSQLTRAADSIPSNIVEGCGAATQKEFARYLDISIKSATETEFHLLAARDRGAVPADRWQSLTSEVIEIRRMTCGLRKKVLIDAASA